MVFADSLVCAKDARGHRGFRRPWFSSWAILATKWERGAVMAMHLQSVITQAPCPRAMTALMAATLAGPHRFHFEVP